MNLVSETRPQIRRDRLLRLPEVESATGLKKSSIYCLMKRGDFPPCLKLTHRSVAWPESRVLQWVQDRIAALEAKYPPHYLPGHVPGVTPKYADPADMIEADAPGATSRGAP